MFKKMKDLLSGRPTKEEPFQQPEDASQLVAQRRLKRRVKALVSVSLALSAGAFLSCQRFLGLEEEQKPPTSEPKKDAPASTQITTPDTTTKPTEAQSQPAESQPMIPPTSQLTVTSQPTTTESKPHKGKSSTEKHRKGMPVLDNLLE